MEVPRSSVDKNDSSSATAIETIRFKSVFNSGYCGAIALTLALINSAIVASWAPSKRMFRTTRRRMRRKTYPRPSLPGSTPSAIKKAHVLAWSAITRSETSAFSLAPYFAPVNSLARSRIILVVSIS